MNIFVFSKIKWSDYKKDLSTELLHVYLSERRRMEGDRGGFGVIMLIDLHNASDIQQGGNSIMQLNLLRAEVANVVPE